jgi:hypothetical protein
MDWLKLARDYGLPFVILAALAWFGVTRAWPLFVEFTRGSLESLRKLTESNAASSEALHALTETVRAMGAESATANREILGRLASLETLAHAQQAASRQFELDRLQGGGDTERPSWAIGRKAGGGE